MQNKLQKYKLILWSLILLPFIFLGSSMFYDSSILAILFYISVIILGGYFLFYQLKIKKQKLWLALLKTAGVIILVIALLAVFLILWTVNIGFSLDGTQ